MTLKLHQAGEHIRIVLDELIEAEHVEERMLEVLGQIREWLEKSKEGYSPIELRCIQDFKIRVGDISVRYETREDLMSTHTFKMLKQELERRLRCNVDHIINETMNELYGAETAHETCSDTLPCPEHPESSITAL